LPACLFLFICIFLDTQARERGASCQPLILKLKLVQHQSPIPST
jgi:hypothetical protein